MRRTSSSTSAGCAAETASPPGSNGPRAVRGQDRERADVSLMPQRPTMWRAIPVSWSISDSAPVVVWPYTSSSAARPPSATLIFARARRPVAESIGLRRREGHAERDSPRDDRDLPHRVGAFGEHADDRVAGLVVGGALAVAGLIMICRSAPSTIRSSASVRSASGPRHGCGALPAAPPR